nr:C45 family autoproteolytic acyltransferase/hydrolase [Prolixibacteraceae bacterium]
MRNRTMIVGIILLFYFSSCKIYSEYAHILQLQKNGMSEVQLGVPRLERIETATVVHLYGEPYEMGHQYGSLLKEHLISLTEIVRELFPEKAIQKYISIAQQAEDNLSVSFREELQGMVDASGVEYRYLLALNLIPMVDCSVLAVWDEATPDGELIMGRNADYLFGSINKAIGLIVVKHPRDGNATVMVSFLGMLGGFTGMNDQGVCYGNMLVHNSE